MFDEMQFLFDLEDHISHMKYGDVDSKWDETKQIFVDKQYIIENGDAQNYISANVDAPYKNKNPYIQLLEDFNGENEKVSKSLKLSSTDFAYLRDIGVYPINRLMVLRRFPIGATVSRDLSKMNVEPIAVVVGWVKSDAADFLNFSFAENWRQQNKDEMLHALIAQIVQNEFGISLTTVMPTPGWAASMLFDFLKRMELVNKDTKLPLGDPNVLRESLTRATDDVGHKSTFSFTMETIYEQKYIGGIDMTTSTMEILKNLITMGTSNITYIGNPSSKLIQELKDANNNPTNPQGWIKLINSVMNTLISTLKSDISKFIGSASDKPSGTTTTTDQQKEEKLDESDKKKAQEMNKKLKILNDQFGDITKGILASTVGKYVWPLRGSIAMLTGEAATPWHLTIGNPYAPLLSLNNIWVTNTDVAFTGEMQYNDIPKYIKATVTMQQGRNMGGNEIIDSIGIEYQRQYKNKSS